jgi:phosphoribosylformylglycinamidine cyclo-ligase
MTKPGITYKDAGVDTEKGQEFVRNISQMVVSTHTPKVLGGLGGFAAGFDASFLKDYKNPVLLSGTDGVGTKLEIARLLDTHDTVGIDLVAMCVNDLLVMGGKPLFFQDYISCGKLKLDRMQAIISGIVEGCRQAGASLVGGETAEHPGVMHEDEYDLAGFAVGVVEKDEIINGKEIQTGDEIIGISSSGPHSNGFSLIRRLFLEDGQLPKDKERLEVISKLAMEPTIIYVPAILKTLETNPIKGMVHITGGGFYENIPRILQSGQGVEIDSSSFPKPEFFQYIMDNFSLDRRTLYSTFNMGIGYLAISDSRFSSSLQASLQAQGLSTYLIGKVTGTGEVVIS